ncbi:MAG: hypothetical protein EB103_03690, partial [Actinobacteria bacterium]|nr:hypothetical protein [Actinomycetota bacterium]
QLVLAKKERKVKFIDSAGNPIGSTALGRQVLAAAANDEKITSEIAGIKNWRKDYLPIFRKVAKLEMMNSYSALDVASRGLAEFERSVLTDDSRVLMEVVREAWRNSKDAVALVTIKGTGAVSQPKIRAEEYVNQKLAEPGIIEELKNFNLESIDENLLIALAGGAEYSPARTWLDWGGTVAIVARARKELWHELISHARKSAGTLYVPVLKSRVNGIEVQNLNDDQLAEVAGLDLIKDYEAISGWLSMLARTDSRRIVLGSYAYAPGVKHIEAQAVQHCLARTITEALPKSRVVLTWLATPTDSYVVSEDIKKDIDVQGPSYALAKRVQRWLAYRQVFADRNVAYLVSPPAKTRSVLNVRILHATYAGSPKFGLIPFEVNEAVDLSAALLICALNSLKKLTPMATYLDLAVHGGLWRLIYRPTDAWRASTIRGLSALLRKR